MYIYVCRCISTFVYIFVYIYANLKANYSSYNKLLGKGKWEQKRPLRLCLVFVDLCRKGTELFTAHKEKDTTFNICMQIDIKDIP